MNKTFLFVIPLSWLLVGCPAQQTTPPPPLGPSGTMACINYVQATCAGDKNDPKVTINLDTKTVTPECIKAKKGKVIQFTLESASPIAKGSVEIIAKDPVKDEWLYGQNKPTKKKIIILAPKKKENGKNLPDGKYAYEIRTSDWCIDPRVNVE